MNELVTRRKFLSLVGLSLVPLVAANTLSVSDAIAVQRTTIAIETLPDALSGFRIGFVSDLHHGLFLDSNKVNQVVSTLITEQVDILLLGGDYIYMYKPSIWSSLVSKQKWEYHGLSRMAVRDGIFQTVAEQMSRVSARLGTYGVFGNHDHWEGSSVAANAFEGHHIPLLKNDVSKIQDRNSTIEVVFIDDYWTGLPELPKLDSNIAPDTLRVVLCHNPDFIAKVSRDSDFKFDLALCGHTHGGQIKLPFFGSTFVNILNRQLAEGLVQIENGLVYTTRGIGTVEIPLRINCPAEISVLTLENG